jgi:hypothetical protein
MKACLSALLLLAATLPAQQPPVYDDHFGAAALRLDLYYVGDAKEETVCLDRLVRETAWPESRNHLIDPFGYGRYAVEVYDVADNRLVYRRGFDSMFAEYRTTAPALAGVKRVFSRSVRIPEPRRAVRVVITARDRLYVPHPIFIQAVDPTDYHIMATPAAPPDTVFDIQVQGAPRDKVDLVFLAEGYTAADLDKFRADVRRFSDWLFETEPYRSARADFNVRGVFRPSPERGMDEPRQGNWRQTTLNASFNAFDLDRYQLTEENRLLREIADQVPCDTVVILTNSSRYGGGGIYNDYCLTTSDNDRSRYVFLHELGHSFAGLADEYYASEVSYNDFYPKGVEPTEPNITAFLDREALKWKDLVTPGTPLPTDWGKPEFDALQADMAKTMKAMRAELEQARVQKLPDAQLRRIQESYNRKGNEIGSRLQALHRKYAGLDDQVGLFEGDGYQSQGLYRPQRYCLMIASPKNEFCRVCQRAIRQMIDYYCGR